MPISRRSALRRLGAFGGLAVAARDARAATAGAKVESRTSPGPIRLNRNESVYGPSAAVLAVIRESASSAAGRYPDIEAGELRRTIAAAHRVAPERVVLGCGSSEILRSAIEVFAGGKKLVVALPVFDAIGGWAERAGVQVVGVPVNREYGHDLSAMLARLDADTRLVYICNPHNPTGRITRRADLEAFLRKLPAHVVVLIDEAYHHYVGESREYSSFIDQPVDDSRVIVTRILFRQKFLHRGRYFAGAARDPHPQAQHRLGRLAGEAAWPAGPAADRGRQEGSGLPAAGRYRGAPRRRRIRDPA